MKGMGAFDNDVQLAISYIKDKELKDMCLKWVDKFKFICRESKITYSDYLRLEIPEPLSLAVFKLFKISDCFTDADTITEFNIPDGVSFVPAFCFTDLHNLSEVHMPESVRALGFASFTGCSSLHDIDIPKGFVRLFKNVFWGTSLDDLRQEVCEECSFVYYKDTLLEVNGKKSDYKHISQVQSGTLDELHIGENTYNIQSGTVHISDDCFSGCSTIHNVVFPESVHVIPKGCFSCSDSLKSVVLKGDSILVGGEAFYGCRSLRKIEGSERVKSWGMDSLKDTPSLTLELDATKTEVPAGGFTNTGACIHGAITREVVPI